MTERKSVTIEIKNPQEMIDSLEKALEWSEGWANAVEPDYQEQGIENPERQHPEALRSLISKIKQQL